MALVTRGARARALLLWGLTAGLASGALACGDALIDGTYAGTPRFTFQGAVNGESESVDEAQPEVSVAVFWVVRFGAGRNDELVEQPGTSVRTEFYRAFQMKMFDEPGDAHLLTAQTGARFGVARLGAYRDVNRNGRRDEAEPLIGVSNNRALLRAPVALSARESPTGANLAAGWHIVTTPLDCAPSTAPRPGDGSTGGSPPVADGDCGVPLGAACRNDGECGAGVCVRDFMGPWPGGACAIPEPPTNGCRQRGSTVVTDPQSSKSYWLKSCTTTDDCGRGPPYQCDQQVRACKPSVDFPVVLEDGAQPRPFCKAQGPTPPPPPGITRP
jgi:hypothetical protein